MPEEDDPSSNAGDVLSVQQLNERITEAIDASAPLQPGRWTH